MAERDDASLAMAALQSFREHSARLLPPPGAKERSIAALLGGDAALERAALGSPVSGPPPGAKERGFARIEARGRAPIVLRPRARWALVCVGLLVASSVGAMTLPSVSRSLPFRLLPGAAPAATVPALGPAEPQKGARPRPASKADLPAGGEAVKAPIVGQSSSNGPAEGPSGEPKAAPAAEPAPAPPASPAPAEARAKAVARPSIEAPAPGDTLARQVGEYQRALALAGRDDEAALASWRAFARRWPASPLRHEVDLQIVAALGRLGRRSELDAAARGFLRDHPKSPRSGDVRNMLREGEH